MELQLGASSSFWDPRILMRARQQKKVGVGKDGEEKGEEKEEGECIPHICHRRHRRRLCKFFLSGVIFFQIEREKLAFYCILI